MRTLLIQVDDDEYEAMEYVAGLIGWSVQDYAAHYAVKVLADEAKKALRAEFELFGRQPKKAGSS